MTERKITAGDWLEHEHYGRVRVAGFDEELDPVFAIDRGAQYQCDLMPYFLASTRPLPGCTGWDWVEPVKPFKPRYFLSQNPIGRERYVYVSNADGTMDFMSQNGLRERQRMSVDGFVADNLTWREVTEDEANAWLTPPAEENRTKWYIHKDPDEKWYVRRDAANHRTIVTEGGHEHPRAWDEMEERYVSRGWWIEVTESEAKARLTPQPVYELSDLSPECKDQLREIVSLESLSTCPDCGEFRGHGHEDVCPMAWVTQDRVPVRTGLDQVHWSLWTDNERWVQAAGDWSERRHGFCDTGGGGTLSVRCRRKDLPTVTLQSVSASPFGDAMSQPANRVPVRLWIPANRLPEGFGDLLWSTDDVSEDDIRGLVEVKHDQNGLFLERET